MWCDGRSAKAEGVTLGCRDSWTAWEHADKLHAVHS